MIEKFFILLLFIVISGCGGERSFCTKFCKHSMTYRVKFFVIDHRINNLTDDGNSCYCLVRIPFNFDNEFKK